MPSMSNKTRLVTLTLILILITTTASSALASRPGATATIEGPVMARVYFASQADLNLLATRLDVWEVHHAAGYLVALLRTGETTTLRQAGYRVEIDADKTADLGQPRKPIPGQVSGIPGFPCYRTVEETYASLAQLAVDYPDLAQWIDIGDSWEKVTPGGLAGYDLNTLVLTNQAIPGPKPKFYLMTAIHAREYATAELATRFAEHLMANYGIDPDITWLLDYYEVHITPQANPDGRKIAETGTLWRKNTHTGCIFSSQRGVDLNRNSSFKWGGVGASSNSCAETYRGPSAASEPETQAIQNYVASIFPDQRGPGDSDPAPDDATGVFLTLHSYWPLVLFPWGWTSGPAPNNAQLETLGRKFGYFNHYTVCQSGEPGCIYQTSGTTDDWAYGELGLAAYTFEVGTDFFESCDYFENTLLPDNLPALLYALKSARQPYLDPSGPESLDVAVSADPANAGTPVTLTATADDTRYDDGGWAGDEPTQAIAAARYSVDLPSWQAAATYPLDPADGAFDATIESLTANVDTTGWTPGRHVLFVESQDADGNWGVPSSVFLNITGGEFSPGLNPAESSGQADPGQTALYTLLLSNLGTAADSYDIQVSGNIWDTSASPDPAGPLNPGDSLDLSIQVTVPSSATFEMSDTATITAISQGDVSKTATATLTTYVRPLYDLTLTPDSAEASSLPGNTVTYELTVTNTGVLADSYTATTGGHTWDTQVVLPDGPLPAWDSAIMTVTVTIPADALYGDSETVQVTLTSQGDPTRFATSSLTSAVWEHVHFLPLIWR
ncbi:MAG: hypothetical protein A2Z49_00205 [Chloroflexi bacterium RBG_19FT_COMBO_56_12]|nr:MAG: hypothetical protein A2Z49_00205 [Chloroflexi bacterium RBG_19FT_COMBO_56_12]